MDNIQIRAIVTFCIYNLPFNIDIWSQVEATMCITRVFIFEKSFYFWPLTRILIEPETWPSTQPNRITRNLAAHHRAAHNLATRRCAGSVVWVIRIGNRLQ